MKIGNLFFGVSKRDFCFRIFYPDSPLWRFTLGGRFYKGFDRSCNHFEFERGMLNTLILILPFVLLSIQFLNIPSPPGGTHE